ncbi:MAG: hypothetical protein EZS28_056079, partial [Streblomastix strix]
LYIMLIGGVQSLFGLGSSLLTSDIFSFDSFCCCYSLVCPGLSPKSSGNNCVPNCSVFVSGEFGHISLADSSIYDGLTDVDAYQMLSGVFGWFIGLRDMLPIGDSTLVGFWFTFIWLFVVIGEEVLFELAY